MWLAKLELTVISFHPHVCCCDTYQAWAAIWLYKATGHQQYLKKAESIYNQLTSSTIRNLFYWDDKTRGVEVSACFGKVIIIFGFWQSFSYFYIKS